MINAPEPAVESDSRATGEQSILGLVNFGLRHRRILLWVPAALFMLVIAFTLLRARSYTSLASFAPQASGSGRSDLAGLAAQFGVSLGAAAGAESTESPAFYADLVRSRAVLDPVAQSHVAVPAARGSQQRPLASFFARNGDSPQRAVLRTVRELRKAVQASASRETGVIELSVSAPSPALAREIGARVLEQVNDFNINRRRTRARAEREFIQGRLADQTAALRSAESRLQGFLQSNRSYDQSPMLVFQHARLQHDVVSLQQVTDALQQRFEQAKIDEVRDLPVITVIEAPDLPDRPDSRHTVRRGIFALIVGFALAIGVACMREILERAEQQQSATFRQFQRLSDEALRHVWPWRRERAIAR